MSMTTAAVLGTGAWGTTFAQVLADAGVSVTMWGRNADTISFINGGENPTYLPGIDLSDRINATTDIAEAVAGRIAGDGVKPRQLLHQRCADTRGEVVEEEAPRPPSHLQHAPKHEDGEHVEEKVPDGACVVQEHVGQGLEPVEGVCAREVQSAQLDEVDAESR